MTLQEFLPLLDGVKGSGKQYTARCPAHEDHRASLGVSEGDDGRILLTCYAGCTVDEICAALNLKKADLFQNRPEMPQRAPENAHKAVTATYEYKDMDGNTVAKKLRYSDKSFCWLRPDGKGGWTKGGIKAVPLYNQQFTVGFSAVYVVEGEKDADTLYRERWGIPAVSFPNGAGSKITDEYKAFFKGFRVTVIQDNDKPGKDFAQRLASALYGTAKSVKLIDLSEIWPEIPEHGDISDYIAAHPGDEGHKRFMELEKNTPEWTPETDRFLSCFKPLGAFGEEKATWLVDGWIPEGQITLLAADGGTGKTSLWCNIVAAISSGKACILDPPGTERNPARVAFLTTEDSVRKKLKRKLRLCGANENNIITPDFLADKENLLKGLKFGSDEMRRFISYYKPVLCVFDPVQGFVPPGINMGSRNAMRDCLAPLISLGEEYGCSFLIICHTNKRKGAYGRDRIADSSDLWDISRSVAMAGFADDSKIRYLSNEKNNYAEQQRTLLFSFDDDGNICKEGTTWKRDRKYMQESVVMNSAPKREECKKFIVDTLDSAGGTMKTSELEEKAKDVGYSTKVIRSAKDELKANGIIKYIQDGFRKDKVWYIKLSGCEEH